jgi:peptidoglycan/LPS O-acetylase OafA/YrhL
VATAIKSAPLAESQPERFYVPELDTLRLLAFLAVFICHAGPDNTLFHIGSFGVDLFFALSAYLITELLLREKERLGSLHVKAFYIRRALRIWPLYYAFLSVVFAATTIPWVYFGFCAVFLGNLALPLMSAPSNVIFPLWSVSVEEQFYLLWPWVVRRLGRGGLIAVACAIWGISIAFRCAVQRHPALYLYCTFGRLDSIAVGILVSCLLAGRLVKLRIYVRAGVALVGALLWLAAGISAQRGSIPMVFVLVALGCGCFLIAALGAGGWMRRSPCVYLGRRSYGLYIFHGAVLVELSALLHWAGMGGDVARMLLGLGITVMLASLSYRWLESPFLRLKKSFEYQPSRPI